MGQIWDFLRSVSVHFGSLSQNVLKLILKSPRFFLFEANLAQYQAAMAWLTERADYFLDTKCTEIISKSPRLVPFVVRERHTRLALTVSLFHTLEDVVRLLHTSQQLVRVTDDISGRHPGTEGLAVRRHSLLAATLAVISPVWGYKVKQQ